MQVIANGGVAAVLALASSLTRRRIQSLLIAGFGGAVATATADTWATEIGSRSRARAAIDPDIATDRSRRIRRRNRGWGSRRPRLARRSSPDWLLLALEQRVSSRTHAGRPDRPRWLHRRARR